MQKYTVLTIAMLFGAAAAPLPVYAATDNASQTPPSVLAFDQKAANNNVIIDYAYLPAPGYIAVYKSDAKGNAAGDPIGYTRVEAGDHRKSKIALKQSVNSGDKLWVSLYTDSDQKPSFDPANGDAPVWSKQELPHQNKITIR